MLFFDSQLLWNQILANKFSFQTFIKVWGIFLIDFSVSLDFTKFQFKITANDNNPVVVTCLCLFWDRWYLSCYDHWLKIAFFLQNLQILRQLVYLLDQYKVMHYKFYLYCNCKTLWNSLRHWVNIVCLFLQWFRISFPFQIFRFYMVIITYSNGFTYFLATYDQFSLTFTILLRAL